MGSASSILVIRHFAKLTYLHKELMANIMDYKPMINIKPFGQCKSLINPQVAAATAANMGVLCPMPCIPNTVSPWIPGKLNVLINKQPALMNDCKLLCMWGGIIQLKDTGQKENLTLPQENNQTSYEQNKIKETYNTGTNTNKPKSEDKNKHISPPKKPKRKTRANSTHTGANKSTKITEIKKCYYRLIQIECDKKNGLDKEKELIYEYIKEKKLTKKKPIYILNSPKGEKLYIQTKRKNENSCEKSDEHSKITIKEKPENTSQIKPENQFNIITKYDAISKFGEKKYLDYISLPIWNGNDFRYKEYAFNFLSCKNNKNIKLIIYPDIKFTFSINLKDDEKTDRQIESTETGECIVNETSETKVGISVEVKYGGKSEKITISESINASPFLSLLDKISIFLKKWMNIEDFMNEALNTADKSYIEIKPNNPSINLSWEWKYCLNKEKTEIGSSHKVNLQLKPLIGTTITFHLLKLLLVTLSGGVLDPVIKVATWIQSTLKKLNIDLDIFADLILSGTINCSLEGEFTTLKKEEKTLTLKGGLEISGEIKIGAKAKAEILVAKVEAEVSVSGKITITLEGKICFKGNLITIGFPITLLPFKTKFILKGKVQLFFINLEASYEYSNEFEEKKWKPEWECNIDGESKSGGSGSSGGGTRGSDSGDRAKGGGSGSSGGGTR